MPSNTRFPVAGISLTVKTWPAQSDLHPAVVLLPATAETADTWDLVAKPLARTRNVHCINLRGHGGSDWPGIYSVALMATDVATLLSQLSSAPVDLIGHSLGGLVACDVAAAHPELVHRLIVEDIGLLHPRPAHPPTKPEGDLPFDWRMVEQVRPEIDSPDSRWPQVVAAIRAPLLVIAGGPRSPVPQEHVADLARTASNGALVTIDAGHFVHEVEPAAFVQAAIRFLDEAAS
jgi:pimeloyl-ACP methyl ester carboxylesterase